MKVLQARLVEGFLVGSAALTAFLLTWRLTAPEFDTLGKLTVISSEQAWGGLQLNRTVVGTPIVINGLKYTSGFGTHAPGKILLRTIDSQQNLKGLCGVSTECENGQVICRVDVAGKTKFRSRPVSGRQNAVPFAVPLDGQQDITLALESVGDATCAHGCWVNLQLE